MAAPAPAEDASTQDLVKELEYLSVKEDIDPTLHSGELIVRQAGKENGCEVAKVTSFSNLPIPEALKVSISKKGWQVMSKIQQVGIPLFLSNPPRHMIAQAQAGTGKTGTFVISALGRLDLEFLKVPLEERVSRPQAIILAITQELVTQIAQVVNELGQDLNVTARRIMSGEQSVSDKGGGRQSRRGRGDGAAATPKAEWVMNDGEDFDDQVVVGTPGKVRGFLQSFEFKRKPYLNPSHVQVLILDEADQALSNNEKQCTEIAQLMPSSCQIGLFSATYDEEMKRIARRFVGNDTAMYHEIVLRKEDLTLDKVDNFFVITGQPNETEEEMDQHKFQAVLDMWESASLHKFVGQSIIFVNRKEKAQQLADFLRANNFPQVGQIHGDMDKQEREKVFQEFLDNKRPALVATNVLSWGIDNPNVIMVINLDLPQVKGIPDAGNFVHRIGRSGRWTKRGASISLISANNRNFPDKRIMQEIERKLFVDVNRPLTMVSQPNKVGEAMREALNARAKAQSQA